MFRADARSIIFSRNLRQNYVTVIIIGMVEFDRGSSPRYSIVIPTFNHFEDCFKPCLDSVITSTKDMLASGEAEIIVVANGCTDGTVDYAKEALHYTDGYKVRIVETDEPLGYTVAVNLGLGVARGEFVVLMNNDAQVLEWGKDGKWLELLREPFDLDPTVGITGPKKIMSKETGRQFVIFFLAMIRRKTFYEVGYLDETFNPGGGEDIDFCMRLEKAGYRCAAVPDDGPKAADYVTSYPIYHIGEATVHSDVAGWEDKFQRRMKVLERRTKNFYYATHADVTCSISTKGRYFSTLPLAIMSVINQKLRPKRLIIFMDDYNEKPVDLRKYSVYQHLFQMLQDAGINWDVVFGEGKGQVLNHQKAIDMAKTEFVWRLDDDNYAEADVLEKLMACFDEKVGAVAGSVPTPGQKMVGPSSTKISEINAAHNMQWTVGRGVVPADHLYSTFVFRKAAAAHGYCKELSVVGHREETIFSHEMKRAGWQLLIERSAVTHHLRDMSGGIRSFSDGKLWEADEAVFRRKIEEWGVRLKGRRLVVLDCGLGDHWSFKMVLQEVKSKYPDDRITIAACYPSVFEDSGVDLISIAEAKQMLNEDRLNKMNVYHFGVQENWSGNLLDAFRELYVKGRAWL